MLRCDVLRFVVVFGGARCRVLLVFAVFGLLRLIVCGCCCLCVVVYCLGCCACLCFAVQVWLWCVLFCLWFVVFRCVVYRFV